MNGRVIPVIGMMPMVMPTFWKTWKTSKDRTPPQMSVPSRSLAICAVRRIRTHISANRAKSVADPTKPSSSPSAVKMKSVCCSGTNPSRVCVPSNRPLPEVAPEARAPFDWRRVAEPAVPRGGAGGDGRLRRVEVVRLALEPLVLVEELRQPVALVVLQQVRVEHADDRDTAE